MLLYILVLFNLVFLAALSIIIRYYIRREVGQLEYVRYVEGELRQLLLEVNRSAEDITQVIEERSRHLRELLDKLPQNGADRLPENLPEYFERERLLLKNELLREIRLELQKNFPPPSPSTPEAKSSEAKRLDAQLRAEIEHYIALGLDARLISQKTGVPLNLVELMVGIKEAL